MHISFVAAASKEICTQAALCPENSLSSINSAVRFLIISFIKMLNKSRMNNIDSRVDISLPAFLYNFQVVLKQSSLANRMARCLAFYSIGSVSLS